MIEFTMTPEQRIKVCREIQRVADVSLFGRDMMPADESYSEYWDAVYISLGRMFTVSIKLSDEQIMEMLETVGEYLNYHKGEVGKLFIELRA